MQPLTIVKPMPLITNKPMPLITKKPMPLITKKPMPLITNKPIPLLIKKQKQPFKTPRKGADIKHYDKIYFEPQQRK